MRQEVIEGALKKGGEPALLDKCQHANVFSGPCDTGNSGTANVPKTEMCSHENVQIRGTCPYPLCNPGGEVG